MFNNIDNISSYNNFKIRRNNLWKNWCNDRKVYLSVHYKIKVIWNLERGKQFKKNTKKTDCQGIRVETRHSQHIIVAGNTIILLVYILFSNNIQIIYFEKNWVKFYKSWMSLVCTSHTEYFKLILILMMNFQCGFQIIKHFCHQKLTSCHWL